jgi:beta-N-acetylhexosaminidase
VGEADVRRLAATVLAAGVRVPYLDEDAAAYLAAGGRTVVLSGDALAAGGPQLRALTSDAACAAGVPVIVALEQDLGREIDGIPTVPPTFEAARSMAPAEVTAAGRRLGEDLVSLGINLNLAPALDLVPGAGPDTVAAVGVAFAAGLAEAGVGAAPGQFPGLGAAAGGPASRDLVPFEAAVAAGVPVVAVADAVFPSIDPGTPASRSPAVLALLRESLGFAGVALAGPAPGGDAVAALAAGIDLLVVGDPAALEPAVGEIAAAVAGGRLPAGRLAEAAERVEALTGALARIPCVGDG